MVNNESILTLRDILKVLFKHKNLIAAITLIATITATGVVYLKPPSYKSITQILVRRSIPESQEPSLNSGGSNRQTFFRQIDQKDEMNTAISILKSRDLTELVIKKMELTPEQFDNVPGFRRYVRYTWNLCRKTATFLWDEAKFLSHLNRRPTATETAMLKWERFVDLVQKAIIIEQVPDSDVLNVGIQMNDPYKAKIFAHTLSIMALGWHYEKFRQTGNTSFFKEQTQKSADDLAILEKELSEMRHNLNLIDIDERRKYIIESRFKFEARLNTVLATLAANSAAITHINFLLEEEPPTTTLSRETGFNPLRQRIIDKISELELRRISEAEKLTDQSRILHDMDTTIESWKDYLQTVADKQERTVIEGVNSIHLILRQKRANFEAELAALTAEAEVLKERISIYDQELRQLSENGLKVADLQRRIQASEIVYAQHLKSSEMARISEAKQQSNMANLNIIQAAALPVNPFKPRKLYTILLAMAGAGLFSFAWAFAKEMQDTSFENEQQLQSALQLESLAIFPHVDRLDFNSPLATPVPFLGPAQTLWARLSSKKGNTSLTSAFVSCRRGEGSSTILLQTALTAVVEGKRVLIVDSNSDAALSKYFKMDKAGNSLDLTPDNLFKNIHPIKETKLSILPIRTNSIQTAEPAWQEIIRSLKKTYDVVLFDIGALSELHPQSGLLSILDGVVLTIAAHLTRREIVEQSINEICNNRDAKLLGLVLNRRKFFIPEFIYRAF